MIPALGQEWTEGDIRLACEHWWNRPDLWERYKTRKHLMKKPFVSDGPSCCSRFIPLPDGRVLDLYPAAAEHDLGYYLGGSDEERYTDDTILARNIVVRCKGPEDLADAMFLAVRHFGNTPFPTWFTWGFGMIAHKHNFGFGEG
jgi:hypothetical protein